MQEAVTTAPATPGYLSTIITRLRTEAPSLADSTIALLSSLLLILSFPDFKFSFLAWVALVPLLITLVRQPTAGRAFILGWLTGSVFFYVSCYWLTYSMINYGGLPVLVAYGLLVPGALAVGVFPGLFALIVALAVRRFGNKAVLLAPIIWVATEWLRLGITGQLWNALGYSQAEVLNGLLIRPAAWGGVYAISFLVLIVNSAAVFGMLGSSLKSWIVAFLLISLVPITTFISIYHSRERNSVPTPSLYVIAVQPNVPMTMVKSVAETKELLERHLVLSKNALHNVPLDDVPRLVVWPESPMNFTYANDRAFQELITEFTTENHTSLIINSLEPAPDDGGYNSALLINEKGRMIAQYDKIRLLPFGEYVPLPGWLPGASLIRGLVGDFTPGTRYTMMPIGNVRIGVFICIEAAYPFIARRLTNEGAEVLINISNDGYLGPTAVMRQHLANAIFRSVENGRPLVRVTNSGISADVSPVGPVLDQTGAFQPDVRTWTVSTKQKRDTFYSKYGDLLAQICTVLTLAVLVISFIGVRRRSRDLR